MEFDGINQHSDSDDSDSDGGDMRLGRIENNTTTDTVKVVMMNGYEMVIDISSVDEPLDIKSQIDLHFFAKLMNDFDEKYGEEPTERGSAEHDQWRRHRSLEVYKPSVKYEWQHLILLDGERIVENNANMVITDETLLTVIIRTPSVFIIHSDSDDSHDSHDNYEN